MLTAFLLWGGDGWAAVHHTFWLEPLRGRLWVGLIVGGFWPLFTSRPGAPRVGGRSAAEVLAERHARGEISTDGYRGRLAHPCGSGA